MQIPDYALHGQWKEDLDISRHLSLVEWEELSLKVTDNLEKLTTKNPCVQPDLRRCFSTQPPASRGPHCARRERVRTFTRVRHEAAREPRDRCQGHAALLGHGHHTRGGVQVDTLALDSGAGLADR